MVFTSCFQFRQVCPRWKRQSVHVQAWYRLPGDAGMNQRVLLLLAQAQTRDSSKYEHGPSHKSPPAPSRACLSISTMFQSLGTIYKLPPRALGCIKPSRHSEQSRLERCGVFKKATAQFTDIARLLHTWQDPVSDESNKDLNDWRVHPWQQEAHASAENSADAALTVPQLHSLLRTAR